MKKILFFSIFIYFANCKAQVINPVNIIPIQNLDNVKVITENDYIKDTNNLLNQFVGTWEYTNGATKLKIVLRKEVNDYNGYYREDLIYGEYQYIENGVEKINTLSEIDTVYQAQFNHSIGGNTILSKYSRQLPCNDCLDSENRLLALISDEIKGTGGRIFLRRIIVNGQPAISALIHFDGIKTTGDTTNGFNQEFVGSTIPNGNYTLIKLP